MHFSGDEMHHIVEDFEIGRCAMRYSLFAPRLYNYCLSLGFSRDKMMPSRAFCSDESQGYPVILLMQQFGTFPFDHGRVGGKVAVNRHGPHAHHGEDLIIVQASHVGYDPESQRFGIYERARTASGGFGDNCGKLCAVLGWYQQAHAYAGNNILTGRIGERPALFIDNQFLDRNRTEGLFLALDRMIVEADGPLKILATSKAYAVAPELLVRLSNTLWNDTPLPIGENLAADLFHFRRALTEGPEGHELLEAALLPVMPSLVTSPRPALDAARYHTQVEFDRTYRSIRDGADYRGKNLLFIAGLNIDVSPPKGMPFPLTKFVPWAAYQQLRDGRSALLEQDKLCAALLSQSPANADQMSFDAAIAAMAEAESVALPA